MCGDFILPMNLHISYFYTKIGKYMNSFIKNLYYYETVEVYGLLRLTSLKNPLIYTFVRTLHPHLFSSYLTSLWETCSLKENYNHVQSRFILMNQTLATTLFNSYSIYCAKKIFYIIDIFHTYVCLNNLTNDDFIYTYF